MNTIKTMSWKNWLLVISFTSLVTLTLLVLGVTFWLYHPIKNEQAIIYIPKGTSLSRITKILKHEKIINSPFLFKLVLRTTGWGKRLQAGEYWIPTSISPVQVIGIIKSGNVILHPLTLIEGETSHHFVQKLKDDQRFQGECQVPPEGSLLPETYRFPRGTQRQVILNHLQKAMTKALASLAPSSLTTQEIVTLASIVEKETALPQERPVVAAVFLNRLQKGIPLQADPTVIYALTKGECDLGRDLTRKDLQTSCPFNTYVIRGLPPSPIANPGFASLKAVVNPASVDYLYFVADGSGGHVFAPTLNEHQKNHAEWRKKRNLINEQKESSS